MNCPATLGSPAGLHCTLASGHEYGHTFVSSSGSHVDDRHEDGGHG